jgi:serine/threonine-protein kinase
VTEDRVADIGTVLGGRYRLLELLGQGGMATIYRARDAQLERDVAVKVLRPEYGRDPDFFARFRQEAQSAASLNHPGVVAVYDYGTDTVGPFIVMELVDGEDLASIIRRSGALPPRQAARLTAQVAHAIAAAHENGFVHRDIKPGNILVTREGRVKVADFGIARAIAEAALTLPGMTLGSVHYFSPEQARGETTTPASDIYSLGIVLFELLTGHRPWTGDSAAAIATARLTGAVPSPSSIRAGIPPILEAITRKAMALDPEQRFASADEMADALDRFLADSAGAAAGSAGAAGVSPAAAGAAAAGRRGRALAAAASGASAVSPPLSDRADAGRDREPNPGARVPTRQAYAGRTRSAGRSGRPARPRRDRRRDRRGGAHRDQPMAMGLGPARPGDPRGRRLPRRPPALR